MTATDKLNLAGILVTGAGSSLAMFGVYKQMNGYFAFRSRDFLSELYFLAKAILLNFMAKAMPRKNREPIPGNNGEPIPASNEEDARGVLDRSAHLAGLKGEDRAKSLIGFYCVFFGFVLQMLGSGLLLLALLHGTPPVGACGSAKQ